MTIDFKYLKDTFGDSLPDFGTFFNTQDVITRYKLKQYYGNNGATDFRRYRWLIAEFDKFIKESVVVPTKVTGDKDAATTTS